MRAIAEKQHLPHFTCPKTEKDKYIENDEIGITCLIIEKRVRRANALS